jgi:hypothetical protein
MRNRSRTQICDATHHNRRSAEFLSHPFIRHTSAEALLVQELTELDSAHSHTPILRWLPCNTHLFCRQLDCAYGAQRRSGLDLLDVLQRGRTILGIGSALGHQQRQGIHNFFQRTILSAKRKPHPTKQEFCWINRGPLFRGGQARRLRCQPTQGRNCNNTYHRP